MMGKRTLVIGASTNPDRYSNMAVKKLKKFGHEVVAIGRRTGFIDDTEIIAGMPEMKDIDTVSLYLNPGNQQPYIPYILALKPRRIIFNPGTENPAFADAASQTHIIPVEACTLVLLSTNQF